VKYYLHVRQPSYPALVIVCCYILKQMYDVRFVYIRLYITVSYIHYHISTFFYHINYSVLKLSTGLAVAARIAW